jgi:predicted nucleic acid-binding protein
MAVAFLDTTVLSNFAQVRRPELLRLALGKEMATTPLAMAELHKGESLGLVPLCDWSWLMVVRPTDAERAMTQHLLASLDSGEAECLAVAQSRSGVFLSDDLAARRLANQAGVSVSGTLGVLLRLVQTKQLPPAEADTLLSQMIGRGYRAPVRSLASFTSVAVTE